MGDETNLDTLHSKESVSESLDLSLYHQWRDYLFKLQLGDTTLQGEQESSKIGQAARCIGQATVLGLAEHGNSVFQRFGGGGVATEDKITDQLVMVLASPEDRTTYFTEAFIRESRRRFLKDVPNYVNAGFAMGCAILEQDVSSVKTLLLSKIKSISVHQELKNALIQGIQNANQSIIDKITEYLLFSQTQLTGEDELALMRGFKPVAPLGSEPIEINGKQYEFNLPNGRAPIELTPQDLSELLPLTNSVKQGRKKMAQQAKETAIRVFNYDKDLLADNDPPKWWTEAEDLERLRSDEVLIFLPFKKPEQIDLPLFRELYGDPNFKGGWNILRLSKDNKLVTQVIHITS